MRFHNITKDDMLNGDGLRVVLWVSGCEHGCKECHNSITWDSQSGILFDQNAKQEIFDELEKSYISGVTFSGGDPLHPENSFEIGELAKEIKDKYPNKTIWLYTGYDWEMICQQERMKYIDVLVDGEFKIDLFNARLLWKGSSNQRVIDVQKTLEMGCNAEPVIYCENYQ
ncbi:MAG: anaerobic ribonucleoside-triphosphate reductase activating protein [Erysipelotrichaceae bacterium]